MKSSSRPWPCASRRTAICIKEDRLSVELRGVHEEWQEHSPISAFCRPQPTSKVELTRLSSRLVFVVSPSPSGLRAAQCPHMPRRHSGVEGLYTSVRSPPWTDCWSENELIPREIAAVREAHRGARGRGDVGTRGQGQDAAKEKQMRPCKISLRVPCSARHVAARPQM